MIGLDGLTPELATDLITLVNSLQKLTKTAKVKYSVQNKTTGQWTKKEFNYVPLDDILEKIKENKNFAFMQPIGYDNESQIVGVKCVLIHKSGKFLESSVFPIKTNEGMKIQDEGAEITYRKRYAAGAFFGIATEEDTDGNDDDASGPEYKPKTTTKKVIKATATQINKLKELYSEEEITKILGMVKKEKIEDLTVQEASSLISKRMTKKDEGKENE